MKNKKTVFSTTAAPVPISPISQGIEAGGFIFTCGQLGRDQSGKLVGPTMEEQTRQALKNLIAVVEAGGGSADSIIRIEGHVTNIDLMKEFNVAWNEFFKENRPTRVCVEVPRLAAGALVELTAIALVE